MKNNFYEAIENRRSIYGLGNHEAVSEEKIVSLVNHMVKYCPSAFNSQSTRIVLLLGDEHKKLRDGWLFCLRKIISACGKLSKKRCKGLCRRINLPQRKKRLLLLPRGMLRFCFLKIRMLWRICKGIFLCMPTIFLCGLCSRAVCCSIWFGRLWKMKEPVPVCSTIIL